MKKRIINVSSSRVGFSELVAIWRVLKNGYIGMGKFVGEFESLLSAYFGREAVCVSTGTSAIHTALHAIGVREGDEVIVPSLTYVATHQAISATGAKAISADVDPRTLTLDPQDFERKINKNTKAVVPVYYASNFSNIKQIYDIANKYGLRVVEDAAHALGSVVGGSRVGETGDIVCFSFDPIKNITSIDGGCVVSSDLKVLNAIRDIRLLGVKNDSDSRLKEKRLYEYDVVSQGWRYHLSNVNAAVGIVQFKKLDKFKKIRQNLAKEYDEHFKAHPGIYTLSNDYDKIMPHIYVVIFRNQKERDLVKITLSEQLNAQTVVHWFPNHLLTKYRMDKTLPNVEDLYSRILTLPLHTKLKRKEVANVARCVVETLNRINE